MSLGSQQNSRPSHKGPYKSMHCKDLLEDLYKTFSQWIVKGLDHDLVMPETLRDSHKRVIKGPAAAGEDLARSWDKNLPKSSQKSFHTRTSKIWHLPQNVWDVPCLQHKMDIAQRTSTRELRMKQAKPDAHFIGAFSVEMHMDISQGNFRDNLQPKYCGPDGAPWSTPAPSLPQEALSVDTLFGEKHSSPNQISARRRNTTLR